jgi:hypothetical protein
MMDLSRNSSGGIETANPIVPAQVIFPSDPMKDAEVSDVDELDISVHFTYGTLNRRVRRDGSSGERVCHTCLEYGVELKTKSETLGLLTTAPGVHQIKELDPRSELARKGIRIGDLIVGVNDHNFEGSCRFGHNELNNFLADTPRPMVLHFHRRRNNPIPGRSAHKDDKTVLLYNTEVEFKFRCIGAGKLEVEKITSSGFADAINTVPGDAVWGINGVQLDEVLRDPSNPDELRQLVEASDRPLTINVQGNCDSNVSAGKNTRRKRCSSNKENVHNREGDDPEFSDGLSFYTYDKMNGDSAWDNKMRGEGKKHGQKGQRRGKCEGNGDLITFAAEPKERVSVPTRRRAQSLLEQEYEKTLNALMAEAD